MLLVIYGNIGVGKTTLAKRFSEKYRFEPICFDDIAPEIFGRDIYGEDGSFLPSYEETQKIYDVMHDRASESLRIGRNVVLESMYFPTQRDQALALAKDSTLVQIVCDREEVLKRIEERYRNDNQTPGTNLYDIYEGQLEAWATSLITIDTTNIDIDTCVEILASKISN